MPAASFLVAAARRSWHVFLGHRVTVARRLGRIEWMFCQSCRLTLWDARVPR